MGPTLPGLTVLLFQLGGEPPIVVPTKANSSTVRAALMKMPGALSGAEVCAAPDMNVSSMLPMEVTIAGRLSSGVKGTV